MEPSPALQWAPRSTGTARTLQVTDRVCAALAHPGGAQMAEPSITKEALRALAQSAGLDISDDLLDELLPRLRRSAEAMAKLEALDLEGVEPANVFSPGSD